MRFVTLAIVIFVAVAATEASPRPAGLAGYNPYEEVIGEKRVRNFGVLQLGGGYGVAKRVVQPGKYETKTEKHRRGPLNGLIPGGAFGRAARSCLKSNCLRLLKGRIEEKIQPYFSFDSDRQATKPGVYKTYQLLEME